MRCAWAVQGILDAFEAMTLGPGAPGQHDPMMDPAYYPRPTGENTEAAGQPPPPFQAGNCDPRFMRLTVNAVPSQQVRPPASFRGGCRLCSTCCLIDDIRQCARAMASAHCLCQHTSEASHSKEWGSVNFWSRLVGEARLRLSKCEWTGMTSWQQERKGRRSERNVWWLQSMRQRYQLPFGAVVHPLADPQDVPVIGLDNGGIVRCKRCRTYINPFVRWSDGGRCSCGMPAGWLHHS